LYVLSNHYENISKKSLTNDFKCGMRVSMNGSANAVQKEDYKPSKSLRPDPNTHPIMKAHQYKPGQSGNAGRKYSLVSKLLELVERRRPDGKTEGEVIAETLVCLAQKEDFRATTAMAMVMDRVDGPVKQLIDVRKTQITLDVDSLDELAYLAGTLQSEPIEITKDSENGVQNVNYQTLGENVSQATAPADSVPSPVAGDGDSHDS